MRGGWVWVVCQLFRVRKPSGAAVAVSLKQAQFHTLMDNNLFNLSDSVSVIIVAAAVADATATAAAAAAIPGTNAHTNMN